MQANLLHVVTAISNPVRWESRIRLYKQFEQHMLASGVNLTVVECALGDRPFELAGTPGVRHIGVRHKTLVWTKENLINIGINALQPEAEYVAWIDSDVEFRSRNWASDTVHALQQYDVVQPWSEALDLGPDGSPMLVKGKHVNIAFCKVWRHQGQVRGEPYDYAHPGYAWAARRHTLLKIGGLFELCGLGAADHQMAMGMIGNVKNSIHGSTTQAYQDAVKAWGRLAYKHIGGKNGFVQGVVEHQFHGAKDKRQYHGRWDILIRHKFDPIEDLTRNRYGVLELAGNKPDLAREIDGYFRSRDEDANVL